MCGYIGKFSFNEIDEEALKRSNEHLVCRGPDDLQLTAGNVSNKFSSNSNSFFGFIFNRLTILDLTEHSRQPMFSDQFNTAIMFNGEIYNHNELRKNLESKGVKFHSDHSDSEVVLNGFSYYGSSFANKLVGQFAITFFDGDNNELTLVRDRLGQKPLFYFYNQTSLIFGSNLKSVISLQDNYILDSTSLSEYLNYGVVTSPKTIFKNNFKVEPAEIITFQLDNIYKIKNREKYWLPEKYLGNEKYRQDEFIDIFSRAVECREKADVEVATFLSGGIDSTSILKNLSDRKRQVNSFSAIYEDKKYDESKWSKLVADQYSNSHYSKTISDQDISDSVFKSIEIFDEPYADSSTVPSYLLSKAIADKYKVALSGDGGDELLGGYSRTAFLINPNRKKLNFLHWLNAIYPNYLGSGNRFRRYSNDLGSALESYFTDPNLLKLLNKRQDSNFKDKFFTDTGDDYKSLVLTEYKFYLSEMMMLKVDRTSMANSLEIRSPFVDHRLIEYILKISSDSYDFNSPKSQLKKYLSNDFKSSFIDRKKMGFVFNVEKWIFENFQLVESVIVNNVPDISKSTLKKLKVNKSRMNGLRLWKLFFIGHYLSSLDKR